jgi:hypothetical protein
MFTRMDNIYITTLEFTKYNKQQIKIIITVMTEDKLVG